MGLAWRQGIRGLEKITGAHSGAMSLSVFFHLFDVCLFISLPYSLVLYLIWNGGVDMKLVSVLFLFLFLRK